MINLFGLALDWTTAAKLVAAMVGVLTGSFLAAMLIERAFGLWAQRRGLGNGDGTLPAVRRYLLPALLVGALQLTLTAIDLPRPLRATVGRLLSVATLALGLYLVSTILLALLRQATERTDAARRTAPQVLTMARVVLLVVCTAILLDNLGVRVTALVTTLGIGSAAVALALQDTLSNFFASIYIQADRPVRVGDYVRLDNGEQGTVTEIGWRSTRLRTLVNTTVVVPNERLLRTVVQNFTLPEPQVAFEVRVTVPYTTDVDEAERLLLEAVRRARTGTPAILASPDPVVRLIPGFVETGIQMTVTAWAREFGERGTAEDAIRRQILGLFRDAAMEIRRG
ncbi:MAG: mechanosensitive ion channel family protein [Candidatus Binatia bacterium]